MEKSVGQRWAEFRHSVVGLLLAAPPTARGELRTELARLAAKTWCHPISGEAVRCGVSTIEQWYYRARGEKKVVMAVLSRKRRSDSDKTLVCGKRRQLLDAQYKSHPGWSAKLHADNLAAANLD